ncbi:MAG: hypothetical protein JNK76_24485 [Planctomycetales bacterium]|nr:hypothetical protein [Planctomycetales bacterium]MBN8626653.1 hypothetical protein [Planctomycetota bacterium]
MTPKLTPEQRYALDHSDGPVPVEDEKTNRVYFLVDESRFASMQQQEDLAAIREGIADAAAGRVSSLDDAMARVRESIGLTRE